MSTFKIGDRVQLARIQTSMDRRLAQTTGVVRCLDMNLVGVEWKDFEIGHTLDGAIQGRNGWWSLASKLELYLDSDKPVERISEPSKRCVACDRKKPRSSNCSTTCAPKALAAAWSPAAM